MDEESEGGLLRWLQLGGVAATAAAGLGLWSLTRYNAQAALNNIARICKNGDEMTFYLRPVRLQSYALVVLPTLADDGSVLPEAQARADMTAGGQEHGQELLLQVDTAGRQVTIKRRLPSGMEQALVVNASDVSAPFLEFVHVDSDDPAPLAWGVEFIERGVYDPNSTSLLNVEMTAFRLCYSRNHSTFYMAMRIDADQPPQFLLIRPNQVPQQPFDTWMFFDATPASRARAAQPGGVDKILHQLRRSTFGGPSCSS